MSILTDAVDAFWCAQKAAGAQRRIEWTPEASRVALKREGKRERMLARLRQGPARTIDLMLLGGSGFSSRLKELRRDGHRITCEEHEDGAVYTLLGPKP
jgi:hypothetical protein